MMINYGSDNNNVRTIGLGNIFPKNETLTLIAENLH